MEAKMSSVGMKLFLLALCVCLAQSACPNPGPVGHRSLDLERFAGTWHMLRAGPPSTANHPNDTVTCLDHTYSPSAWNPRVFEYIFKEQINGAPFEDTGIVTVTNWETKSNWNLYANDIYYPLDILATDYNQYAILYICDPSLGDDAKVAYMLMSRTRAMDAQLDSFLVSYVEGLGLAADEFNSIGHDACS